MGAKLAFFLVRFWVGKEERQKSTCVDRLTELTWFGANASKIYIQHKKAREPVEFERVAVYFYLLLLLALEKNDSRQFHDKEKKRRKCELKATDQSIGLHEHFM